MWHSGLLPHSPRPREVLTIAKSLSRILFAGAITALVVTAVGAPAGSADAASSSSSSSSYVALGDSFAAGYGLSPSTARPVPGCAQSSADYPHRVAEALDLRLTDVTCAGAVTANIVGTRQTTRDGSAPPQVDALSRSTKIVTVTIGGNDLGFLGAATSCTALSPDGPLLNAERPNCKSAFDKNGTDALATRIEGPVLSGTRSDAANGVAKALAAIRSAAPWAKVFVVGYPAVFPNAANTPPDGCFRSGLDAASTLSSIRISDGFPFTDVDVRYLNSVQQVFDRALRAEARRAGFSYISTLTASAAHTPCAPPDRAYVNGVSLRSGRSGSASVAPGSLHPNDRGARFLAGTIIPAIKAALPKHNRTVAASAGSAALPVLLIGLFGLVLVVLSVGIILVRRRGPNVRR